MIGSDSHLIVPIVCRYPCYSCAPQIFDPGRTDPVAGPPPTRGMIVAWSRRLESSFGCLSTWPVSSCGPRHPRPIIDSASASGCSSDRCRVARITNNCRRPRRR